MKKAGARSKIAVNSFMSLKTANVTLSGAPPKMHEMEQRRNRRVHSSKSYASAIPLSSFNASR